MFPIPAALAVALQLSLSVSPDAAARPTRDDTDIDVAGLPQAHKVGYALFRQKCSTCHPLSRATTTRLTPAQWKRHVRRMAIRPSTALSDDQAQSIIDFLEYYASRRGAK